MFLNYESIKICHYNNNKYKHHVCALLTTKMRGPCHISSRIELKYSTPFNWIVHTINYIVPHKHMCTTQKLQEKREPLWNEHTHSCLHSTLISERQTIVIVWDCDRQMILCVSLCDIARDDISSSSISNETHIYYQCERPSLLKRWGNLHL